MHSLSFLMIQFFFPFFFFGGWGVDYETFIFVEMHGTSFEKSDFKNSLLWSSAKLLCWASETLFYVHEVVLTGKFHFWNWPCSASFSLLLPSCCFIFYHIIIKLPFPVQLSSCSYYFTCLIPVTLMQVGDLVHSLVRSWIHPPFCN